MTQTIKFNRYNVTNGTDTARVTYSINARTDGRNSQIIAFSSKDHGADAALEIAPTLRASQGGGNKAHVLTHAVRRLTPRECERLQGFPDDYTAIPKAADAPRYKALGNSMACHKMAWIGQRILNEINRLGDWK